jgi:hypothetical protein
MTDEEIRIKVAETMGWKPDPETKFWYALGPDEILAGFKDGIVSPLPDYLNDLNACSEFEAMLTDDELWEYSKLLMDYRQAANGFPLASRSEVLKLQKATAAQRCIAFLKTKGVLP